jgi:hypothetical protein
MQEWGVIISAAGLAILVLTSVGGLVWKLSRIEIGLRAEYSEEIAEIKADAVKELAALSAKLYQVEIWSRDEFVRKGSFEAVIARMEKGFWRPAQRDRAAPRQDDRPHRAHRSPRAQLKR